MSGSDVGAGVVEGRLALVTGASRGIGRAVALALAGAGADVWAVGRDPERGAALLAADPSGRISSELVDLTDGEERADLCRGVLDRGGLDILVHCAGTIEHATMADADPAHLRAMLEVNVMAAYELTRAVLPALVEAQGDIVFVSSSVTRFPRAHSGQFAITQHGLIGLANALREEVNPKGVRVLTVFPGRTATPRTERLARDSGGRYEAERLLQPESVAETILCAVSLPRTAEVTELHIRPANKG